MYTRTASPFFFVGGGLTDVSRRKKVQPLVLGSWGSLCEFQFIINLWVFSMQLFIMKHSSPQLLRVFFRGTTRMDRQVQGVWGDFCSAKK